MVRIEQRMTRHLVCIDATQATSVAAYLMRVRGVGSLLVKRGDELVGIMTESDIVRKVVAFHLSPEFVHVEHTQFGDLGPLFNNWWWKNAGLAGIDGTAGKNGH